MQHHAETLFSFRSKRKNVNNVSACGAADTEQHMWFTFSEYSPTWRQGDVEETNCFNDVLATFLDLDRVRILAVCGQRAL